MDKKDVKNILISMRTHQNETAVNNLLGKIDSMAEGQIQEVLNKLENSEQAVKQELSKRIAAMLINDEKYPINKMFEYGVSGNSIHLHLPVKLEKMMRTIGPSKTFDIVNLYLLDAIEKIGQMKEDGFYRFQGTDNIYMISPILLKRELEFLERIDFKTQTYKKEQLKDERFVEEHSEARLGKKLFGSEQTVGTAIIQIDKTMTQEWKTKKQVIVKKFKENGITMEENARIGGTPERTGSDM